MYTDKKVKIFYIADPFHFVQTVWKSEFLWIWDSPYSMHFNVKVPSSSGGSLGELQLWIYLNICFTANIFPTNRFWTFSPKLLKFCNTFAGIGKWHGKILFTQSSTF